MNFLLRFFILLLPMLLSACTTSGIMQNHDKRYLAATSIPPTRVPPGVSSIPFHNAYPAPDHAISDQAKEVSLVPPGLY
jgi:uncharacterized lipoprotein